MQILRIIKIYRLLLMLFFAQFVVSCQEKKPIENTIPPGPSISDKTSKVFVLNEGLYAMNNSTLSLLDLKIGSVETDIFFKVNKRKLGDTGNELKRYGNKMYVCVSSSNVVEVLDLPTCRSIAQIRMYNENGVGRNPRKIAFWEGKAYVACFDGTVCKIDTQSLSIEAFTKVGRNPDGICAVSGKLYVSNSGGLDYPRYDSTVSVVSIESFKEIKKINLKINPYIIEADSEGDVYVCTRGNYEEVGGGDPKGYGFQCIDSKTDELVKSFDDLAVLKFVVSGDTAYLYSYDYKTKKSWFKRFDLKQDKVVDEAFIKDGTSLSTPYGIAVDPYSGDVYIADAFNFMISGRVYCFSSLGYLKYWREVGVNPNSFVFVN